MFDRHLSCLITEFHLVIFPTCCHLFVVGGLRTSVIRIAMLAGVL